MDFFQKMNAKPCDCGREHDFRSRVISGKAALLKLPELVRELGGSRAYILSDRNTWAVAGQKTAALLQQQGIDWVSCCMAEDTPEPDEHSVGSALMHYDAACDIIIGVGSGVINDIGKLLSAAVKKPYIIVATAPSMDGYASATSSMVRGGMKISLSSKSPEGIIGDTDILCTAPLHMMRSGLGDVLAKYVAICEWRISHLITGEYYCEQVAQLVRRALKRCIDGAPGLMNREESAVQAVFEGLVLSGVAMNFAGLSRPASGVEHYISHVLDMRSVEFGTPCDLHGIQCAVGTLIAVKLYEKLVKIIPNREKALAYVESFDYDSWAGELRGLIGKGAQAMIDLEKKEGKYDKVRHAARLEKILGSWKEILAIISEELPSAADLERLMDSLGMPKTLSQLGTKDEELPLIFRATKDIRDKYVLSHLAWDLGIVNEILEK